MWDFAARAHVTDRGDEWPSNSCEKAGRGFIKPARHSDAPWRQQHLAGAAEKRPHKGRGEQWSASELARLLFYALWGTMALFLFVRFKATHFKASSQAHWIFLSLTNVHWLKEINHRPLSLTAMLIYFMNDINTMSLRHLSRSTFSILYLLSTQYPLTNFISNQ